MGKLANWGTPCLPFVSFRILLKPFPKAGLNISHRHFLRFRFEAWGLWVGWVIGPSRHLAVSQNHVGKWKIKTSGASPSSLHVEPRRRLRRTGRPELEPQDPVGGAAVCRGGPLRQEAPRNSWHVALEQADRSRLHARVFCLFVLAWGISTWNERIAPSFSSSFLESCGLFFLPSIFVLSTQMVVFSCWAFDGCAFLGGYPLLAGFQGKPKGTPVFCGPTLKKRLPVGSVEGGLPCFSQSREPPLGVSVCGGELSHGLWLKKWKPQLLKFEPQKACGLVEDSIALVMSLCCSPRFLFICCF